MRQFLNLSVLALLGWLVQMVARLATGNTVFESDGQAVNVDLTATVVKDDIVYADGWLGIAAAGGDTGDSIALSIGQQELQIIVPSTFDPAKGSIVYIDITDVTGHTPNDTAYSSVAGANKVAFCKTTSAKDANHVVTAIMLPGNLAS